MGKDPVAILRSEKAKLQLALSEAGDTIIKKDNTIAELKERIFKLEAENKKMYSDIIYKDAVLAKTMSIVSQQREEIISSIKSGN